MGDGEDFGALASRTVDESAVPTAAEGGARTEHGILFSNELRPRCADGSKTQTRRTPSWKNAIIDGKPTGAKAWANLDLSTARVRKRHPRACLDVIGHDGKAHEVFCRIQAGDVLWTRESCIYLACDPNERGAIPIEKCVDAEGNNALDFGPGDAVRACRVVYRSDQDRNPDPAVAALVDAGGWRPALHCHRFASRLLLEVTEVRVQKLDEISEEDALAEGVERCPFTADHRDVRHHGGCACHLLDSPRPYACSFFSLWDRVGSQGEDPWVFAYSFRRMT